jgi:peptidoglycan hydrolase CwlO-like protein
MLYGYKIQDIERNLSSAGFWERRKMQKEMAEQEKKRNDFYKEAKEKYGTESQLKNEQSKLLAEKTRIENATGVTAAREAEQERKRETVRQQHQSRDRYNAERRVKRLENPNVNKNAPSK